jgi:hypothetical protein
MTQQVPAATDNDIIRIDGDSLTLRVGEYRLILKIDGPKAKPSGRLQLGPGRTLFDIVLESARTWVKETGKREFSAADLYYVANRDNPELNIRRNSWNSHMMSSTPDHPSYGHYTAKRRYFRYLSRGKYCLSPEAPEFRE